MFQYAYGWYLARRHNCPLWLDIRSYEAAPAHGYLLDRFQITAEVATEEILQRIPARYQTAPEHRPRRTALRHMWASWSGQQLKRHKETPFGFHPRHLAVSSNRYVVGYWQSESFFPGMRDELLQQFRLRRPLSDASQNIVDRIRGTYSLALHVRRGDYLSNSEAAQIYCILGLEYYQAAIDAWAAGIPQANLNPEIFVFSNDIPWCRSQFAHPWKTTYVDHNTAATAYEDLILLSAAQSCVIANSTFSWWGAWLQQGSANSVYAPAQWFRPNTLEARHIIPESWKIVCPISNERARGTDCPS